MRWIVGTILALVATVVVAGNLIGGIRARQTDRGFSSAPFVGAALGVAAVAVLPVENRAWLVLAVLFLDFTVPMAATARLSSMARAAVRRQATEGNAVYRALHRPACAPPLNARSLPKQIREETH